MKNKSRKSKEKNNTKEEDLSIEKKLEDLIEQKSDQTSALKKLLSSLKEEMNKKK